MKLEEKDLERFLGDVPRSDDYRDLCNYILRGFVGRELDEDEVRKYAKQRYKEPSSYNLCLALFKSLANYLMKRLPQDDLRWFIRERAKLELIRDLKRERVVKRLEKRGLEIEEIRRVLKKCGDELEFSIIWLLFYFGCRPGELVALEPKMVDQKRRVIRFVTEKTKVERELHFDEFTGRQLSRFLDAKPSYSLVYKVCKQLGIEPKAGRQSFITHQMRQISKAGWDPVRGDLLVKTAAGHTTPDISAVYADLTSDLRKLFTVYHYLAPIEEGLKR